MSLAEFFKEASMEEPIRYSYKEINQQQLESELDTLWQQLKDDDLAAEARAEGINLNSLVAYRRDQVITVTKEGHGLDPVTTTLIVAFSPVAARVAKDLWTKILLPRILRSKGKDALSPKK
jgi:hypothetical protein